MLSKLILPDKVKANYDPITHFLKMKQLCLSFPLEHILRKTPKTSVHL